MQIFFDLDGPLLDVSERYYAIYSNLLIAAGHETMTKAEYWNAKRACISEAEIVSRTCPRSFVQLYLSKRSSLIEKPEYLRLDRVWDGIPELLATLSREHRLYVVTMRRRRQTLMWQLKHFRLVGFFERVFSRDNNAGCWAVKYELIERAIADVRKAVIIGDTEADIRTGRALGIATCAVTCGIRDEVQVMGMGADYVLTSAMKLVEVLPELER